MSRIKNILENIGISLKIYFDKFKDFFWYNPKRFISNVLYFRKELKEFRPYDHSYNLGLLVKSLEKTSKYIRHNGYNVDREKVADDIDRFCELYKRLENDPYMEEVGYDYSKIDFKFDKIEGSDDLYELSLESKDPKYTNAFRDACMIKSDRLREKDEKEFFKLFEKYREWWD